jgi:hypothetical protein
MEDSIIKIANQLFEIEKKSAGREEFAPISRNIKRMRDTVEELGYAYKDPTGEPYNETRTDCEASISGSSISNLYISETIKPLVYKIDSGINMIVQKAVVIVEAKN